MVGYGNNVCSRRPVDIYIRAKPRHIMGRCVDHHCRDEIMITLSSELKTAQDGLVRNPICRITSSTFVDAIPFDGQYFNTSETAEQYPSLIETESRRLAMTLAFGSNLTFRYSDTEKIQFTDVTLVTGQTSMAMYEASLCEIESGVIGIIYSDLYSSTVRLRFLTISETGELIVSPTTIASYAASGYQVREVSVIKLATSGFMAVYRKTGLATPVTQSLMKRTSADFITWSNEHAIDVEID